MAKISFCNRNHFILILLCICAQCSVFTLSLENRIFAFMNFMNVSMFLRLLSFSIRKSVESKEMSLRWNIPSIKKYKMRYFRRFTWLQAHKNYINVYLAKWKRTKCIKSLIFFFFAFHFLHFAFILHTIIHTMSILDPTQ